MERMMTWAGVGVLVLVGGTAALCGFRDPMNARRADMARELADIEPVAVRFAEAPRDFAGWERAIAAKPALWEELVAPPPPPPAPKPPPPDWDKILRGVRVTRHQVGQKVRVFSPGHARGEFLGVGDAVNGATIKAACERNVVFAVRLHGREWTRGLRRD